MQVYCCSHAFSGFFAYSEEALRNGAPKEALQRGEFSSGQIWQEEVTDLAFNFTYVGNLVAN